MPLGPSSDTRLIVLVPEFAVLLMTFVMAIWITIAVRRLRRQLDEVAARLDVLLDDPVVSIDDAT